MACSCPPPCRRTLHRPRSSGFTLVELLVVIVILVFLMALLIPAISSSIRTAKNAAVSAEISQLDQALASFKSKYGDYPPSRVYLNENGYFPVNDSTPLISLGVYPKPVGSTQTDITLGQLAQRSLSYMRKFFPRAVFSTTGAVWTTNQRFYDYNGNGVFENGGYILQGHECLVFFLGGIPLPDSIPAQATSTRFGMTGFGKDPVNPFSNSLPASPMYSGNRQPPLFEFDASRLALDPQGSSGIPGYLDSLGNTTGPGSSTINFYAYFSSYGSGGYDPNDVNFPVEADSNGVRPLLLRFRVGFPLAGAGPTVGCISPAPNPYTSSVTFDRNTPTVFLKPQTFQIISSGVDGEYGVGGRYDSETTGEALPHDPANTSTTDANIRRRENDNLTNFHNGRLQ
jgi:prepilin-type N-terminal cleavage/methylation domain-containing protein